MIMKREREVDHSITMANYLMLLSRGSEIESTTYFNTSNNVRVFECKTCNRQFPSFQALGGHRASHKKPRLILGAGEGDESDSQILLHDSPPKPKTHECSICGLEFAVGQALGGHMRRHRAAAGRSSSSGNSSVDTNSANKKKGRSKRVLFLDLNLTPLENDLEILKIRQATPLVDCFN